jgi:adenylosuccinate synthase
MPKIIVLISGNVSAGKTTLSEGLRRQYNSTTVKTKEVLQDLAVKKLKGRLPAERKALQEFGTQLDSETSGEWVLNALKKHMTDAKVGPDDVVVVDAVRILPQIKAIRRAYQFAVKHIHIEAPSSALAKRYKSRGNVNVKELPTYAAVEQDSTESRVATLRESADFVVDTERCTPEDILVRVATYLGLVTRDYTRLVDVYVGGQYGSEGKGHIISYVAREYQVLVRVGGPNAGHKVYMDSGAVTHHQLPSGTLRTDAKLLIGPGAVLNIDLLMEEIARCRVSADRLGIDPQAMIITKADIAGEAALQKKIGSTKQGVGFATARKIRERGGKIKLAGDYKELQPYTTKSVWEELEKAYSGGCKILVEGTQGTGLSIHHGSYPFVTSRDTTVAGCLSEAGISPSRVRKVIMVCRTYPIRVQNPQGGTSGPMSREILWNDVSRRSKIPLSKLKRTEKTSTTNRDRRVSEFDWALLRKAAALNGPTDVALTFADYLHKENEDARRFEQLHPDDIQFIEQVERVAAAPVSLISTRFDFRSIIDRRAW